MAPGTSTQDLEVDRVIVGGGGVGWQPGALIVFGGGQPRLAGPLPDARLDMYSIGGKKMELMTRALSEHISI